MHGAQFAVQMPVRNENLLKKLLFELVKEQPFVDFLDGWKRDSPVLSMDESLFVQVFNGAENSRPDHPHRRSMPVLTVVFYVHRPFRKPEIFRCKPW